jgi:hypothetical protein
LGIHKGNRAPKSSKLVDSIYLSNLVAKRQ